MKRSKVAIFDIDGTIFRSSLLIELVDALIQERVFRASAVKMYEKAHHRWLDREGDYDAYIEAVVRAFLRHIKGVAYEDFVRVTRKVIAFHKSRVYRYTRDLVRDLKRRKYYILAISNSPKEVLDEFCRAYGFDKVYGRIYEINDKQKFTGKLVFQSLVTNKANVLKRAISKENLTLAGSVGVGDSEADIAFLRMVERPICFNPNKKLYQYGKKRGWRIVVERKDMVYSFRGR